MAPAELESILRQLDSSNSGKIPRATLCNVLQGVGLDAEKVLAAFGLEGEEVDYVLFVAWLYPDYVKSAAQPAASPDWASKDYVRQAMLDDYDAGGGGMAPFMQADESLRGDHDFAMEALNIQAANIKYVTQELKANKGVGIFAVQSSAYYLEDLDPVLFADRDVIMAAVYASGSTSGFLVLKFADPTLRADFEVVLEAARRHMGNLDFVDKELRNDVGFARQLFSELKDSYCRYQFWPYFGESVYANREFMLEVLASNGKLLKFADPVLQADKEVVLTAVQHTGYLSAGFPGEIPSALEYAAPSLKADSDVVLAAVALDGNHLQFADESMKADREIVLAAVRKGLSLQQLPGSPLLGDRELVLEAVTAYGANLQYVDQRLKGDREIVLKACKNNDLLLAHASPELLADPELSRRLSDAQDEYDRAMERAMR